MHQRVLTTRRGPLLGATALAGAMLLTTLAAVPALADGGAGGRGSEPGGAGGTGFTGNNGSPGSPSDSLSLGGGGGGGGAGGGNGGAGSGQSGGGGGGGNNGTGPFNVGALESGAGAITGGNGGAGGNGLTIGAGGGGGAGGYGAIVTGAGSSNNTGSITGGNGGAGGSNAGPAFIAVGGSGGDGGVGVQFTAGISVTFVNSGTVTGGNGGAGSGFPSGNNGAGGAGIVGAGLTIVNNGTIMGGLSGDGVTRADAIIFTGGTGPGQTNILAGTGTVGSFTMISGSTFAPGSFTFCFISVVSCQATPGTSMRVAGNLAFQSGASYLVQVNPTATSFATVTGRASLAGTVQAVFAPGSYDARTYTILSASGGIVGTFNSLSTTGLPADFQASLSYTGTDAQLKLIAALEKPGETANESSVARGVDNAFNTGRDPPSNLNSLFNLTGSNLDRALDQLDGEVATGAQKVAFQLTDQFLNVMLDPFVDGRSGIGGADRPALGFAPEREAMPPEIALAYASVLKAPPAPAPVYEPRWTAWGGAYGGSNRTTGDLVTTGSHNLSASTAGVAGGLDYHLTRDTLIGFAIAGGGTNWSLAEGVGGGKSDAFQAGLYGATRWGPAYVAAAFAFANHWMSTDRFAFENDHLTANFNAQSFGGRVEGGYRFATMFGGLTPYAAVQAQSFHTPGYSETDTNGGGDALVFNSRTAGDTRSELGARFDRLLLVNPDAVLAFRGRVAWAHDWVSDPILAAVFQTLPGSDFTVDGATPAKNSALASAGVELRLANGFTLLGKFDGDFASHSSTYAGTGAIRYRW
jgi:uncharacterized protein with beta-barrel porin domain